MSALMTELTTGPLASQIAPHLAAGEIGLVYGILHAKTIPAIGQVSWGDFTAWLASGPILAVTAQSTNTGSILEPSALVLLMVVQSGNGLDLSRANVQAMFQLWLSTSGGITQAQHDSLMALAQHNISRADQIPTINTTMEALAVAMFGGDVWP